MKVYATNVIYSRIIGLQVSGRDDLKNELAPVPVAMFDNSGDMRVAKIKSTLKRELQVETLHLDQSCYGKVQGYVDKAVTWTQECSRNWCLLGTRQIQGV